MIVANGAKMLNVNLADHPSAITGETLMYGRVDLYTKNAWATVLENNTLYFDTDPRHRFPEELKDNFIYLESVNLSDMIKNRGTDYIPTYYLSQLYDVYINKKWIDIPGTRKYNSGRSKDSFYLMLKSGLLIKCMGSYSADLLKPLGLKKKDSINPQIIQAPLGRIEAMPEDILRWWCIDSPIKRFSLLGILFKESPMIKAQVVEEENLIKTYLNNTQVYIMKACMLPGEAAGLRRKLRTILGKVTHSKQITNNS